MLTVLKPFPHAPSRPDLGIENPGIGGSIPPPAIKNRVHQRPLMQWAFLFPALAIRVEAIAASSSAFSP
jgi:hypothetical protein